METILGEEVVCLLNNTKWLVLSLIIQAKSHISARPNTLTMCNVELPPSLGQVSG